MCATAARTPSRCVERPRGGRAAGGIEPAGVDHDLDAALAAGRAPPPRAGAGRCARSRARIPQAILQQDHERQLGEVVAGQHVDRPALDHLARRAQAVAVEAAAVRDAQTSLTRRPRRSAVGAQRRRAASASRERRHALGGLRARRTARRSSSRRRRRPRPSGSRATVRTRRLASRTALRAAVRDRVDLVLHGARRAPRPARRGGAARSPARSRASKRLAGEEQPHALVRRRASAAPRPRSSPG